MDELNALMSHENVLPDRSNEVNLPVILNLKSPSETQGIVILLTKEEVNSLHILLEAEECEYGYTDYDLLRKFVSFQDEFKKNKTDCS